MGFLCFATSAYGGKSSLVAADGPDKPSSPNELGERRVSDESDDPEVPEERESPSRLSDEVKPINNRDVPRRPLPLFELGDPFLETGPISEGFEIPTGAIWQPRLMLYGDARAAMWTVERNRKETVAAAWEANLFANLNLSATERILFGVNPFAREGRFTSAQFQETFAVNEVYNFEPSTLFFEGEVGELFPKLDNNDQSPLDLGFSIGRQNIGPELFGGFIINDRLDAIGLTQNSLRVAGFSNLQVTGIYAWGDVHRGRNASLDDSADLFSLSAVADFSVRKGGLTVDSTVEAQAVYVRSDRDTGDSAHFGIGSAQRFSTGLGQVNTTLRYAGSLVLRGRHPGAGEGHLFFAEASVMPSSENTFYATAALVVDDYAQAARDPFNGGALSQSGILFARLGTGTFPSALSSLAEDSLSAALGWQHFFLEKRMNVVVEAGLQSEPDSFGDADAALGARWQWAVGQRFVFQADGWWVWRGLDNGESGLRGSVLVRF